MSENLSQKYSFQMHDATHLPSFFLINFFFNFTAYHRNSNVKFLCLNYDRTYPRVDDVTWFFKSFLQLIYTKKMLNFQILHYTKKFSMYNFVHKFRQNLTLTYLSENSQFFSKYFILKQCYLRFVFYIFIEIFTDVFSIKPHFKEKAL